MTYDNRPAWEKFSSKEWASALMMLTPGGSEFLTPQECSDYIRASRNWPSKVVKLRADRDALLAACKWVEWTGDFEGRYAFCPACGNASDGGHALTCKLALAIAQAERP